MGEFESRSEIAQAIDDALTGCVLVVGCLPPMGRDLSLLATGRDYDAIARWLTDAGFLQWRDSWARFGVNAPDGVELVCADSWSQDRYRSTLLQDAEPIPGFCHLVRPGPAAALLLAARGIVGRRGRLTAKSRAEVADALVRNPQAWIVAEQQAPGLGLLGAVLLLRRAYEAERPLPMSARTAGLAGLWVGKGPLRAKGRVFAEVRPPRLRPAIVSFSGLDGSGKSTQVALLRDHLEQVGVAVRVEWAGEFATGWRLHRLAALLDLVIRPNSRRRPTLSTGDQSGSPERPGSGPDAFLPLGWNDPVRMQIWTSVVAALNAAKKWQLVARQRRGTEVVIFDRFTPDTAARIDYRYGHERHVDTRWPGAIFRILGPKPDVGFFMAVPGALAHSRRPEEDLDGLEAMSRAYVRNEHRFHLIRLDGTETVEDLAQRVAVEAWQGMR